MCAPNAFAAARIILSLRNVVGRENICVPFWSDCFGKYFAKDAIVPADAPRQV